MISLRDAFGTDTTARVLLYILVAGSWDGENQWVEGGYAAGVPFRASMLPTSDKHSGTHGQTLKPTKAGERYPATMKFRSRTEMPINAIIVYNGINYKVTKKGDYNASGYWSAVGQLSESVVLP